MDIYELRSWITNNNAILYPTDTGINIKRLGKKIPAEILTELTNHKADLVKIMNGYCHACGAKLVVTNLRRFCPVAPAFPEHFEEVVSEQDVLRISFDGMDKFSNSGKVYLYYSPVLKEVIRFAADNAVIEEEQARAGQGPVIYRASELRLLRGLDECTLRQLHLWKRHGETITNIERLSV